MSDIPLTRRKPKAKPVEKTQAKKTTTKKAPVKSEAIKNGMTKKSTIEFDGDLYLQMKVRVAERGMKMREYIHMLIREDLKK